MATDSIKPSLHAKNLHFEELSCLLGISEQASVCLDEIIKKNTDHLTANTVAPRWFIWSLVTNRQATYRVDVPMNGPVLPKA